MDRVFRIDFYPHDWLVHTASQTPEQRGIFIQICAMIYANRGPIKNDAAWIGRASNCSSRLARSIIQQLVDNGNLTIVNGDFITQKRCESELKRWRTWRELGANSERTERENDSELKENKDLHNSDKKPPHPTPSHLKGLTPLPPSMTESIGVGGFKKIGGIGGGGMGMGSSGDGSLVPTALRELLPIIAAGFDPDVICNDYAKHVADNGLPRNLSKAFPAWVNGWVKRRANR